MSLETAISHVSFHTETGATVEENKTNTQSKRRSSLMAFEFLVLACSMRPSTAVWLRGSTYTFFLV